MLRLLTRTVGSERTLARSEVGLRYLFVVLTASEGYLCIWQIFPVGVRKSSKSNDEEACEEHGGLLRLRGFVIGIVDVICSIVISCRWIIGSRMAPHSKTTVCTPLVL